ncbi:MAG: OadG family protein [Bacteroidales bacterium]|nr:OadG family protein [Bacteroidales bacterium]
MATILLNFWDLGLSITLIGYTTVLFALSLLWGFYTLIPKIIDAVNKYELRRQGRQECAQKDSLDITGETAAAIAMALHFYFGELHETESGKITIKRVSKNYSPWSSKIYSVTRRL